MEKPKIITVTPDNIKEEGIFCIKNPKHPGFQRKVEWYLANYEQGLRLQIAKDEAGRPAGFIEYVPAEYAWRPVEAPAYLFIHCLWVYPKKAQSRGFGSALIEACLEDARQQRQAGVAVMTSGSGWMAGEKIFLQSGFRPADQRGRFQLMAKKLDPAAPDPQLLDWTAQGKTYPGWHLLYADQCPMHEKSARDLLDEAHKQGIELHVKQLTTAAEARQVPGGFGVYSLIHDGEVLQDHYVSRGRFRNILKKLKS